MNWFNFWFYLIIAFSVLCLALMSVSILVLIWKMVLAA